MQSIDFSTISKGKLKMRRPRVLGIIVSLVLLIVFSLYFCILRSFNEKAPNSDLSVPGLPSRKLAFSTREGDFEISSFNLYFLKGISTSVGYKKGCLYVVAVGAIRNMASKTLTIPGQFLALKAAGDKIYFADPMLTTKLDSKLISEPLYGRIQPYNNCSHLDGGASCDVYAVYSLPESSDFSSLRFVPPLGTTSSVLEPRLK